MIFTGLELIYHISGLSIKNIHHSMVASTENEFTILKKTDLSRPLRPLDCNRIGTNLIPRVVPIQSWTLGGVIYTENTASKVSSNIST